MSNICLCFVLFYGGYSFAVDYVVYLDRYVMICWQCLICLRLVFLSLCFCWIRYAMFTLLNSIFRLFSVSFIVFGILHLSFVVGGCTEARFDNLLKYHYARFLEHQYDWECSGSHLGFRNLNPDAGNSNNTYKRMVVDTLQIT